MITGEIPAPSSSAIHPGERRGPVASAYLESASLRYANLRYWAPAFAGVVVLGEARKIATRRRYFTTGSAMKLSSGPLTTIFCVAFT